MRPPLSADQRDVSGLDRPDSELMPAGGSGEYPLPPYQQTRLADVLDVRRSRLPTGPITLREVATVLSPLMTVSEQWLAADGYAEKRTATPSAGGRHPLTALILTGPNPGETVQAWATSPSATPRLRSVRLPEPAQARLLSAVSSALRGPSKLPTVVVVLARLRRTTSKYPDGESLVWRDAGVFLGYAHLIATTLGLESSIVGIGETAHIPLHGCGESLIDVGALALGGSRT